MPLRDHFRPPLASRKSWEGLHGQWPSKIVDQLNVSLPPEYEAEPRVHLGSAFEIDVSTYVRDNGGAGSAAIDGGADDGSAALWSPGEPALLLESETPLPSEYEVLVYDVTLGRRLVAAVEIVSPANKDRAENRRSFVYKCDSLLRQGVCVAIVDVVTSIVDVVTIRTPNLYRELAEILGAPERTNVRTPIYAVACRGRRQGDGWRVESWEHELHIGQPLPTLPLWLNDETFVPLQLEDSYELACQSLRIA